MNISRAIDLISPSGEMTAFVEPVYFVAQDLHRLWPELHHPDAWMEIGQVHAARLHSNESIWVVSTYLRLKAQGLNVKIVDGLVPDAINICTAEGLIHAPDSHHAFIVAVQADRGTLGWGHYTLVQSPVHAVRRRACLIDCWPQPGLIARDPARGDQIRRVGYLGYSENLAQSFRTDFFRNGLASLGVAWIVREKPADWNNYADLDLCLAVRDLSPSLVRTKPATKLFHAWITGCPALLGNEPAFRYWGDPGSDYFEVKSPAEGIEAVRLLQRDPALYSSVRERGRAKAPAHDEQAVLRQWVAVLAGPISHAFDTWRTDPRSTVLARAAARRVQRVVAPLRRHLFYLRAGGLKGIRRRLRQVLSMVCS